MALVELETLYDVALAEIMRSALEADGIPAMLFESNFGSLIGGGFPGIRLMVLEDDVAAARRALDLPAIQASN
ncbi:putative signal transducing protein [Sandaracinobacteroides saxicola]|uniref:DUF2007 domain-containing protein n=1 Tax=Sandaracinobacteroides saxicola TaxID=2759707 RepID=A0A7G5IJG2_9SPHN|nr:DUF2007 domain-containing protein [Sandaracinobacteroides saxicola]QMW23504.1 DUF2007 domain-containing protein [Sandaracinobacteroides saxicola]